MRNRDKILAGTAIGILMAASTAMGAQASQAVPSMDFGAAEVSAVDFSAATTAPAHSVILAQADDDDKDKPKRHERREGKGGDEGGQRAERGAQRAEPKGAEADTQAQPRRKKEAESAKPEAAPERQADKPAARKAEEPKAAAREKQAPEQKAEEPRRKQAEPKREQAAEPKAAPAQAEQKSSDKSRTADRQRDDAKARADRQDEAGARKLAPDAAAKSEAAKSTDEKTRNDKASDDKARDDQAKKDDSKKQSQDAMRRIQNMDDARIGAGSQQSDQNAVKDRDRRNADRDGAGRDSDRAGADRKQSDDAAPMLDSQKDAEHHRGNARDDSRALQGDRGGDRNATRDRDGDRNARTNDRDRDRNRAEGPRPDSDRSAQRDLNVSIKDIRKLNDEKGRRIDERQWRDWHRRDGAQVVKREGDRTLVEFNNQIIVQDRSGHERISRHARDVYYEELPNELRREVVVRPDGSKVITVRNGYGDIVRRTRVVPGGQEYVLVYSGGDDRNERWHDPAEDLPPLQIDIPRSEYILESDNVQNPDRYYEFLEQPPVEPVQQLYTIDQVKYSSRVRDMVRRVDLDTINFETGSADITQSELPALEGVANAMQRMIDKNPAETFLIEGHTDAVGSDDANLILSDERAEAVATALTDVYKIPPENLFTQGYGEQYLKIDTSGAERENRRVAIRRITPLVTPVASAQ